MGYLALETLKVKTFNVTLRLTLSVTFRYNGDSINAETDMQTITYTSKLNTYVYIYST